VDTDMNKILEKTAVKANDYFNLPLPARLYIDSVIKKETTPIDNDLPITTSQQIGSETIQAEGSSSTFSGVFNKMFGRDDELKNRSIVKQISSVQPRPSSKNAFNQSNDVLNKQLEDVQIKQTNENQSYTYDISIQDKINKQCYHE
jgi:hypothetical protein